MSTNDKIRKYNKRASRYMILSLAFWGMLLGLAIYKMISPEALVLDVTWIGLVVGFASCMIPACWFKGKAVKLQRNKSEEEIKEELKQLGKELVEYLRDIGFDEISEDPPETPKVK